MIFNLIWNVMTITRKKKQATASIQQILTITDSPFSFLLFQIYLFDPLFVSLNFGFFFENSFRKLRTWFECFRDDGCKSTVEV